MRIEKRKIKIKMNSTQISKIFYRDNKIISLGTDCKISTVKFPKMHNYYINDTIATAVTISDVYSTIAYIEDGSEVKF